MTDEKKPPWPGDLAVSPVAAVSITHMGVTTPCRSSNSTRPERHVALGLSYGKFPKYTYLCLRTRTSLIANRKFSDTDCDIFSVSLHRDDEEKRSSFPGNSGSSSTGHPSPLESYREW